MQMFSTAKRINPSQRKTARTSYLLNSLKAFSKDMFVREQNKLMSVIARNTGLVIFLAETLL